MRAFLVPAMSLLLLGCGAGATKPPDAPTAAAPTNPPVVAADWRVTDAKTTGTAAVPLKRCGTEDSYRYVAQEFRCENGTNPLGGSLKAGHDARRGSMEDRASGHMIDVYEVPCLEGTQRIYIDMYSCPEQEDRLKREMAATTRDPVRTAYAAGRYADVIEHCQAWLASPKTVEGGHFCLVFHPAALFMSGDGAGALRQAAKVCEAIPEAGPDSDMRAKLVIGIAASVVSAGEREGKQVAVGELMEALRRACDVPKNQLRNLLEDDTKSNTL